MGQTRSIFHGTNFFSLSDAQQRTLSALPNAELVVWQTPEIFRQQAVLNQNLAYFTECIKDYRLLADAGYFHYLEEDERQALAKKLLFAYYLLAARLQLDWVEKRGRVLPARRQELQDCAGLIEKLQCPIPADRLTAAGQEGLSNHSQGANSPVKYLSMQATTAMILEVYQEIADGQVQSALDIASIFNERRLYWVWAGGGGLLGMILTQFSDDFYHTAQAKSALAWPQPYTAALSWSLYYVRFAVRALLIARHVVPNRWMRAEEYNIPWTERFVTQWQYRKFYLINDFFWACANLACAVWLCDQGMSAYYGGVLTGVLLLMDVAVARWAFVEEKAQYEQDMLRYRHDIQILQHKLSDRQDIERPLLQKQIAELRVRAQQTQLDWDYKLYALYSDLLYAITLFVAFALVCSFFFPPAVVVPATAVICNAVGTVLCFACNALFAAAKQGLNVSHTVTAHDNQRQEQIALLQRIIAVGSAESAMDSGKNVSIKRQLYLDYQLLQAKSAQQEEQILYQKMTMLRSTVIDILVPPAIFLALVFLPMGVGLPLLAAAFALAVCSYYYVEANYAPQGVSLPAFDEGAFNKWNAQTELNKLNQPRAMDFFHAVSGMLRTQPDPACTEAPPNP